MARLRRAEVPCECPLIGVDRKGLADRQDDANDPLRTSSGRFCCNAQRSTRSGRAKVE
jgi:hypothetical protein